MNDLESPYLQVRKSFLLAMGFSLLLHAVVLFMDYSSSNFPPLWCRCRESGMPPQRRLIATLARSPVTPPRPSGVQVSTPEPKPPELASKRRLSSNKKAPTKSLSAPAYSLANRNGVKGRTGGHEKFSRRTGHRYEAAAERADTVCQGAGHGPSDGTISAGRGR